MANWAADVYDTLAAAETAIELIADSKELRLIAFKQGLLQKVMVAQGMTYLTAVDVWETDISAYSGAGYAGTYLKTLYDDWLNGGRLDLILDDIGTQTEELVAGKLQIATTTEDLNQAVGAKDLLTGTTQSVILEKLSIRMPTEAASAPLTSISIQTDDVTPSVIISSTDGAVANLTSEAQLAWTGAIEIPVGTKIQLTIAGGAHGTAYTTTIVAQYRAVITGGNLA